MSRRVTYWTVVVLLLVATIVVSVAVSGGDEPGAAAPTTTPTTAQRAATTTPAAEPEPQRALVLIRRRTGLPESWIQRVRRSDATLALTRTSRTQWLLRRTTSGGEAVTTTPAGYAIPLDTFVVDPRAYARVTGDETVRRLRAGRVLLSESGARLRRLGRGDRLTLSGGHRVTVAGVVSDGLARDAEVVAAAADVPPAERRQTQVTVATEDPSAIARAVPDDRLTRVAQLDITERATQGNGIVRPVVTKQRFGEFAVRLPYGEDWIDIDPAWRARNIVSRSVPILGNVTCHRRLIAPLREALGTLRRRGLSRLVDPGDYAGCHAPRRIPGSGSLSLHAWGLAVDINASENPQGSEPTMDRRIVRAFEDAGFTWGGRWPTAPDGMHFELH
jgi:D-alanyl-D-alanine carboxypeptidase